MRYGRRRTSTGAVEVGRRSASRSTTRRRTPARRRRNIKRGRRNRLRRVSRKAIKNVVEGVMMCKENVGVFNKTVLGEINPIVEQGYKNFAYAATRKGGNIAPYTAFNMSFTPYITKRIWDAASILFDAKSKSVEVDNLVDNFTYRGLKIDCLYASYNVEVVNYTTIPFYMEWVEITNKSTNQASFGDVMKELITQQKWVGGAPDVAVFGGNQYRMEHSLDFGMIKGLSTRYSIKSKGRKLVGPGHSISWFGKDKRCVDLLKNLYTEGSGGDDGEVGSFCRGETQLVLMYEPVLHATTATGIATEFYAANETTDYNDEHGFLVKTSEVFKIMEPDATADANQGDCRAILNDWPEATAGYTKSGNFRVLGLPYTTLGVVA